MFHHESIFGIFISLPSFDSTSKLFHILQANSHLIFASHRIASLALDIINCLDTNPPKDAGVLHGIHFLISIPMKFDDGPLKIHHTQPFYAMRHFWCQADYTVHSASFIIRIIFRMYFMRHVRFTILQCNKISPISARLFSIPMPQPIWDARRFCHLFYSPYGIFKN